MQNVVIERGSQIKNETVEGFRLSPQQRHLWSLQQANLSQPYSAQGVVIIEGSLDLNTLYAAIQHVVGRNEILRTVFQSIAELDFPVQVITTDAAFSLEKHEPADSRLQNQETAIEFLFQAANREPLDFERGPLFHGRVMSLSTLKHLLHVRVPALCADEIGLVALVREIGVVYAALISDAEMPEEPMQYADVSEFLNEMLESKDTATARDYWRDKSMSDSAHVRLPLINQTFAGEDFEPRYLSPMPDGALMAKVENLAARHGRSISVFLQATWQLFLWRLTGQSGITIGTVHDGRTYEGLDKLPGLLARTLPLTCHFANGLSFNDLLEQVSQAAGETHQRQEYFNFDHLAQNFIDNLQRVPFFPLSFEFSDQPLSFDSADLKWTLCKQQVYSDRFTLKLHCVRTAEGSLRVEFHYDRGRLAQEVVEKLARNYFKLLMSLVANPFALIDQLEIVDDREREKLVCQFNSTTVDFQTVACIQELFERQVERTPDALAVVYEGNQLTYAELNRRANQLAHYLIQLGVARDTLVGLLMERSLTMVVGLLGVLKSGAAYVPLDPSYPTERLQLMMEDARVRVLLTQQDLLETASNLGASTRVVSVDGEWERIAGCSADNAAAQTSPDNLAYVIYTSGSTGRPKGAMIPHRAIVNHMLWMQQCFPLTAADRVLQKTPFSFDASVWEFYAPLLSGAVLVMAAPGVQQDVGLLAAVLSEEGVTVLQGVPSLLRVLVEEEALKQCRGQLRRVFSGGEALTAELAEAWRERTGAQVYNLYGPTETTIDAIWSKYESGDGGSSVPIGRPVANMRAYVVNEEMQLAPLGVAGELYLGGAGVGRGYLYRPELTAEKFLPDPFSDESGARLYRTGDLVRHLPNGELEYLGRNDQQLKLRGFRIELGEIEAVLEQHEGVKAAVVILYQDAQGQNWLIAYVVVTQESLPSNNELRSYLKERLPEYMVPQTFLVLDALPLLPNGKVNRSALPAPGSTRPDREETYVAPRTEIQEVLAAIWSQVLGIEKIGIHDNFFDLGGDSIRSVRMVALAKKRGLNFTVQQIFHNQTIAELEREFNLHGGQAVPMVHTAPFDLISEEDRQKLPATMVDAYPLAMMQQAMLYHLEMTPDSPAYHNVNSWHVRAPFNEELLRAAVKELVVRHPVLRTSFDLTTYSRPLQLVHREAELPLEVFDLRHLSPEEQVRSLNEFLESETQHLFDLSRPTLMRYFVHRRTDESFSFSLTENHAILDGWSTTSTLAELFEVYISLVNHGIVANPEPLNITYRDFINLELQALASEESRRYWLQTLTDATPVRMPRWPGSRPTSEVRRIDRRVLPIEQAVYEGLKQVARTLAVPLKTVIFTAHLKVMSMISGQDEMLTGITLNGRPEETDGTRVRGLFLNTVPFRFKLFGGTWSELIRAVFEAEWNLLPHRRYPLGAMQKNWGHDTLVETNFNFLHFHSLEEMLRTGQIEVLAEPARDLSETNFTLQTTFETKSTSLEDSTWLDLEFDTTQTCVEQREALMGYYDRVLQAIAADPLKRHDLQDFLSDQERERICQWSSGGTMAETDAGLLPTLFAAQAERTADAVAAVFKDRQLSYQELNQRANQLASYLRSRGIGTEVAVGVLMERSLDLLVSLLGVLKAGAAYVPLDPSNPRERLAFILEDAAVPLLLTQQRLAESLQPLSADVVCVDTAWEEISQHGPENRESSVLADNLAYIIYTSGSTGKPKGTLITHRGLANYLTWCARVYEVEVGEGAPVHSSISFDLTVTGLFAPLLVGRKVVFLPEEVGIEALLSELKQGRNYSLVKITPSQLSLLSQGLTPAEAAGSTRRLVIGGENLLGETVRFWQDAAPDTILINEYGPTETVVGCCVYEVPASQNLSGSVPIGRPIINTQLYVLDRFLQPLPVGVPGELYIGGTGVARGYLKRPELTAEKFVPHPFSDKEGERLYRTGDLVRYLPDGNLEFLGRIDDQVKILGYRIEVGEVESVLEQHPAISDAFVMAYEETPGEKRLVAYLVATGSANLSTEELREFLGQKIPMYAMPSAFVWLEQLPLSASGKVDRRALPAPGKARQQKEQTYTAPQSEIERVIADIWQEVLQVDQVGIHDNFFDLGGDSFSVYEVHHKLRERLASTTSILDLFKHPTIDALARHLSQSNGVESSLEESHDRAQQRARAANRRKQFVEVRADLNE